MRCFWTLCLLPGAMLGCGPVIAAAPVTRVAAWGPAEADAAVLTRTRPSWVPLGTANPMEVRRVAPDGSWAFVCQAREDTDGRPGTAILFGCTGASGDALMPYWLTPREPEGERIERFYDADRRGRFVAFLRGEFAIVQDTWTGAEQVLARDATERDGAGADADEGPGWVRLHPDGIAALFARGPQGSRQLIERDLHAQTERVVPILSGAIATYQYVAGGRYIAAVTQDGYLGSGRISRRLPPRTHPACSDTPPLVELDAAETTVVRRSDGAPEARPIIAHGDPGLLVRAPSGAHVFVAEGQSERVVVPASCQAQIVAWLPEANSALASCAGRAGVHLFTPEGQRSYASSAPRPNDDGPVVGRFAQVGGRYAVVNNTPALRIDLKTGRAHAQRDEQHLASWRGVTVRRSADNTRIEFIPGDGGQARHLDMRVAWFRRQLGPLLYVERTRDETNAPGGLVLDVERAAVLGGADRPFAIRHGRALGFGPRKHPGMLWGPLMWRPLTAVDRGP